MITSKKPVNEHFKAAVAQAAYLPFIYSKSAKHAQQQGILRELLAGLRSK